MVGMSPWASDVQLLGIPMLSISMSELIRWNDRADLALDSGEFQFGLFDSHARGPARVKPHLTGVDSREKILADQHGEPERSDGKRP